MRIEWRCCSKPQPATPSAAIWLNVASSVPVKFFVPLRIEIAYGSTSEAVPVCNRPPSPVPVQLEIGLPGWTTALPLVPMSELMTPR